MISNDVFPTIRTGSCALDDVGLPKRIIAISDIHGMSGHFDRLVSSLDEIEELEDAAFYILGDMVDRGPDSRGVVNRVIALMDRRKGSLTFIGNHDMWFLRFLRDELDPYEIDMWLTQGGKETLESYGASLAETLASARRLVIEAAPGHCAMLEAAESIALIGDFAFVHAGVDPLRPLDRQSREDCAWIRSPFMRHEGRLSHVVVHGHTPQKGKRPTITENRISIDTGAVYGGLLTAAIIDREHRRLDFVATDGGSIARSDPHRLDRGFGTALEDFTVNQFVGKRFA
ncbi:serine/threonine protein phosphatase [Fulvimarina pelagi HTCC2506]|uniref:Serine/threonine protein phosphatase n=1 Tax=Fulvimarina pelagi HTCC2506 TaxID=314231 RepID=Q0G617_9HYPH|nr:metallophosphoesterase [Fulvimarina pelagi]EAU42897.1 serine/threonine protein phosphatase [Fulvimarina pelagi HTCC2506]